MKKLPFLISIPHGGNEIPPEIMASTMLSQGDIFEDGDAFTREIYALHDTVETVVETDIARAFVDMNRKSDDFPPDNSDGVIKSQTCYKRLIYLNGKLPSKRTIDLMLKNYYFPFHKRIKDKIDEGSLTFAFDCHSMATTAPPIAHDSGTLRPTICLGNNKGLSCSLKDSIKLKEIIMEIFELSGQEVQLNQPFSGGHITRTYGNNPIPWIQIELNRSLYLHHPWFNENKLNVDMEAITLLNKNLKRTLTSFHDYLTQ